MLSIPAPWPERLGIVSRALAAIVGGYASTAVRAWGGLALALAVAALPAALRWLGWMAPLSAGGGA